MNSPELSGGGIGSRGGSWEGVRRVRSSRQASQRNYDRLSRWYEVLTASERQAGQAGRAQLAVQPGERVLEIGFGPGRWLPSLARKVAPDGTVVGADISWGMVRTAAARLRQAGGDGGACLVQADGMDPPFASDAFDALFICFTLELFDTPDIPPFLAQCRRVLRPGGRLCVVALDRPEAPGVAVRLYEWAHDRWPTLLDCRPIPVARAMAEAGFTVREVEALSLWGLPVAVVVGVGCAAHATDVQAPAARR